MLTTRKTLTIKENYFTKLCVEIKEVQDGFEAG